MVFRLGDSQKHYFIRDLGSSCGTFLNGQKLTLDEVTGSVKLSHGDVISLGLQPHRTYRARWVKNGRGVEIQEPKSTFWTVAAGQGSK
jgi:hypothetical protein